MKTALILFAVTLAIFFGVVSLLALADDGSGICYKPWTKTTAPCDSFLIRHSPGPTWHLKDADKDKK